ncbi:hypothetical protein ACRAWD_10920 [Caulobacter segnis]
MAGARVGFDVNGDGHEDVFILLGGATASSFKVGLTIANDHVEPSVTLVGQASTTDITSHVGDPPAAH